MVSKSKGKNHLTFQERKLIKEGIDLGLNYREIGDSINRNKSIINREIKRLGEYWDYDAKKAQQNYESKQKLAGIRRGSLLYVKIKEEENLE